MNTTISPTIAATRALNDLVDEARRLRNLAMKQRREDRRKRLDIIAKQLDATRTRLVQDGERYIPTAWAIVDAGRQAIAMHKLVMEP